MNDIRFSRHEPNKSMNIMRASATCRMRHQRPNLSHALAGRIFRGSSTIFPAFTFRTYDLIREHVAEQDIYVAFFDTFPKSSCRMCISSMLNISDQTQILDAKEYAPSLPVHGIEKSKQRSVIMLDCDSYLYLNHARSIYLHNA